MKKQILHYLTILTIATLFASCASREKMVYFQNKEGVQINDSIISTFETKIQRGDLLTINVSAIDGEAAIPFNIYDAPVVGGAAGGSPAAYLVDAAGEIYFPVLGKVKVAGLTTKELNDTLTKLLVSYINEPIINIRLTNFKITVMGEVSRPGTYTIPNERVSILEALGLAGDLTIQGKRENVTLIREQNGVRQFVTLDLTNKQLFNSPYFYLAQNDVIYVEPNKPKLNSSAVGTSTAVVLSSATIVFITLLNILLR